MPVESGVEIRHLESLALELTTAIEHGLVFNFRGDNVLTFLDIEMRGTLYCKVIRLSSARRPNDLTWVAI